MAQIKADWLEKPQTQNILTTLEGAGHQAFVVGGCVRNAVLGLSAMDIDVATSAVPELVTRLFQKAGSHVVPTGVEHGTVTVVMDGESFEITTFRKDVETDGRRAVVNFADSIADDAMRRDFTMNALYCDARGQVFDPVNGLGDAIAKRVRFVGDPGERIREDYLRSLRFFRFLAQFGGAAEGVDPDALSAIAKNLDGLEGISAERVGAEMVKLLASDDPATALSAMEATGALTAILPGASARMMAPLVHLETALALSPEPIRRLVALGSDDAVRRLRLSRQQGKRFELLCREMRSSAGAAELGWRFGRETALSALALRHAATGQRVSESVIDEIERGREAILPISASDVMPILSGAALGAALERASTAWIESGFSLEREALIRIALEQG